VHRLQVENLVVAHLVRRFFGFVTARALTPTEQQRVRGQLRPALAVTFFAQRMEDQRHAFEVERRADSQACSEAALLHDIGKTESNLGAVARSFATMWDAVGLTTSGRWRSYLDHNSIGAKMLEDLDAGSLAVVFTLNHPGPAPEGIDVAAWQALEDADNV
jgi:putative nucleotidyltransferase with HDIG domain